MYAQTSPPRAPVTKDDGTKVTGRENKRMRTCWEANTPPQLARRG